MITRRRMLYIVTWLTDFSLFLLIFTVSRSLAAEGMGLLGLGLAGGGISLSAAVSSAISGRLSDHLGRRRVILSGIVTLLFSSLLCAVLDTNDWGYYAAYGFGGVAVGMVYPPLIAWLNQGRNDHQPMQATTRTLIAFCVAWNFGMISGQVTGGWLFRQWGPSWPLFLSTALAGLNLAVVLLAGRAPCVPTQVEAAPPSQVLQHRALSLSFARLCWIANLGGAFSMSMVMHLFPQLAVALGVPPDLHGIMLASSRAVVIATYLLMHYSRFWHYRFGPALAAQAVALMGLVTLATAQTTAALTLGLMGLAVLLGYNYFASLYYSTSSSGDDRRGAASGLHEATLALGFAGGAVCGGVVGRYMGNRAPYLMAAGVVILLAIVQVAVYWRRVRPHLTYQETGC